MVGFDSLFFFLILCAGNVKMYRNHQHRIMTPNIDQSGPVSVTTGNFNEIAMFPPSTSNILTPSTNIPPSTASDVVITPISTTSNISPNTTLKMNESTVTQAINSIDGTVIRIEFPSSITVYVNITNSGGTSPFVNITNAGREELPTTVSTIITSISDSSTADNVTEISVSTNTDETINENSFNNLTTDSSTSEISVTSTIPTPLNTTESSSIDDNSDEETSVVNDGDNATLATSSTTELSTVTAGTESSTASVLVDISFPDDSSDASNEISTIESITGPQPTDTSTVLLTIEDTVEIMTESTINTDNNPLTSSNTHEYTTEAMRNIQININLSDGTLNGNFGSTTQSTAENLGQLQNKMIYKQKCDEYFQSKKTGRQAQIQIFIVGGSSSEPEEFPHMAALGYGKGPKKEWLCGGSLISENFVITAAHCLTSKTLGDVQLVRLGTTLLNAETLTSENYKVIRRIPHPNYTTNDQYNDIALLQLDRSVDFSDSIFPICLHSSSPTDKVLIATGWGKTEPTGDVSPDLQKVELEYFSNKECQDSYSVISKQDLPRGIVDDIQICAGSRNEEKDTCQGDSGGPLQFRDNDRTYLVGVTSFGIGCGKPGRPGVYTRVSHYIPWIEQNVWSGGR